MWIVFSKNGLLGAVIGAFIAVYIVEASYVNGIFYGGLPTSMAGLISVPMLAFLLQNQSTMQLGSLMIISPNYFLYLGAIPGFFTFLFIGAICGIMAVAVRKRNNNKFIYMLIAFVVIVLVIILSNVIHVGTVLSSFSGS